MFGPFVNHKPPISGEIRERNALRRCAREAIPDLRPTYYGLTFVLRTLRTPEAPTLYDSPNRVIVGTSYPLIILHLHGGGMRYGLVKFYHSD